MSRNATSSPLRRRSVLQLILASGLALGLAACGGGSDESEQEKTTAVLQAQANAGVSDGLVGLLLGQVTLHHQVQDADAAMAQAQAAGGTVVMPLQDMFWGDRYGVLKDLFGHQWSIATHMVDLTPEQIMQAVKAIPAG